MQMNSWTLVRAADLIDFNPRESLPKNTIAKKVAMERLKPFTRDIPGFEVAPFSGGSKFRNGDTIMARITPCLENGKTAQVSILDDGEVGFGSTEFIVLRAKPGVSDKDFIYYLSMSPLLRDKAIKSMVGSSGRQRVQQSVLDSTQFYAPPLPEQVEIGRTLRALDDKIANNTKINHHLEQIAQAIFKSWFVDFEPFGGEQPTEWQGGSLGNYVEIKRGGSPRPIQDFLSDTGLRWLKISDVTSLQTPFVLEIKEHIKASGLKKTVFLKSGALVLSNSATPGIPKILGVDTCIHDGWLYFSKSLFSNEFLYLFFKHIRQDLVALGNGSVFTNLKTDILKAFPVVVPDEATMRRFDETIAPIFRGLENSTRESAKIATLRDSLLPRLMSGGLSVADIDDAK
jgi:type I restriction enzyme S subunit